MRKGLFFLSLPALIVVLSGCSTPPPPPEPVIEPVIVPAVPEVVETVIQSTLPAEMRQRTDDITQAGGLAALGIAESKSLDLALNMAKKNGRLELARELNDQMESLAKAFSEETGIPYDSLLLAGFNNAARMITKQTIAGSIATELKYETAGDTTTAYAIMSLDPEIIAAQLAQEPDLYPRLQPSKAFDALNQKIKAYNAFLAARKSSL